MKSRILMMVSMLFTALMLVISASAQGRVEKVYFPCQVYASTPNGGPKPSITTLHARIKNNTGTWLAEGRTIYYELKISNVGGLGATHTFVLGEMIPDGNYAQIWEGPAPPLNQTANPFCRAWYLK